MSSDLPFTLYHANKRRLDLLTAINACPKGLYIAASPIDDPSQWQGVLFVRQGLYASGIFRFNITFPPQYPARPPSIVFTSDVFHPLVTPTSTYRDPTRVSEHGTTTSTDQSLSPPGAFSLKHGFPDWSRVASSSPVPVVRLLYYMRAAFTHSALIDSLPYEAAANPSAWLAYQSFKSASASPGSVTHAGSPGMDLSRPQTPPDHLPEAQIKPGGARKPEDWSWAGVWEDRLSKCIRLSTAERTLYVNDPESTDMINFIDIDHSLLDGVFSSEAD